MIWARHREKPTDKDLRRTIAIDTAPKHDAQATAMHHVRDISLKVDFRGNIRKKHKKRAGKRAGMPLLRSPALFRRNHSRADWSMRRIWALTLSWALSTLARREGMKRSLYLALVSLNFMSSKEP